MFFRSVEEEHAAPGVPLGERDDEPQVRLEKVVLRVLAVLGDPPQLTLELGVDLLPGVQLLLGEEPGLDPLGELDLLLGVEERDLADLLEVVLDRVGGGAGRDDLLRGRVVLVGMGADSMELPVSLIQNRELVLTGVFRYANTWPTALALVRTGAVDLDAMVTARFGLDQLADALGEELDQVSSGGAIVKAVRGNGQPVWCLLYADEGHGFAKKANNADFKRGNTLCLQV